MALLARRVVRFFFFVSFLAGTTSGGAGEERSPTPVVIPNVKGTATTTSLTYASLNANRSRYMQQRLEGGFQDHLGKSLGKSTKEPITPLFVLPAGLSPLPEMPDYVAAQPTEGDLLY